MTKIKANTVLSTDLLVNNGNLAALQWATGSLLNNANLMIATNTTANSVDSMYDIGMNFMTQPEITRSGCDVAFTY